MFQLPAQTFTDAEIDARWALPSDGYRARIQLHTAPMTMEAGAKVTLGLTVTNMSAVTWLADIPGGRHICLANHWLDAHGSVVVPDDARARLRQDLAPGQSDEMRIDVQTPASPGKYLLEIDLVQERICWFAQRGSVTLKVPLDIAPASAPSRRGVLNESRASTTTETQRSTAAVSKMLSVERAAPREGIIARLKRRLQGPPPFFEMHVVSRDVVERTVAEAGGRVLHAIEDGAAGAGWLSYTYVCRKAEEAATDSRAR
ncbi:MAG: hypothetical protein QM736_20270 [Vicinamibacterales bacterium]